ncbi:MAG: alpha/beta fold hydrolase, partial [Saprospiraceae bacterium]|nr:alpha/beta fold hydrolase [Saprospiraceae bacterium]
MNRATWYLFYFLLTTVLMSCQSQADKSRTVARYTIEQFYDNKSVFGSSFSADEKSLLVTSNESGIYNCYRLDLADGGMTALTNSAVESVFAVSCFPNDDRILYSSDRGGNEITHIYLRSEDGTVQDLTPWDEGKSQFFRWARDDQRFFFTSNQRDSRFFDLYEMDITFLTAKMIYENTENLDLSVLSDNNRYLAMTRNITTSKNELFLFDRESDELVQISSPNADATFSPQFFSKDNQYLYFLSDENEEFARLVRMSIANRTTEEVFKTNWDVWYAYDSYNGKYRVIGVNEDGKTSVQVQDLSSGQEVDFPTFQNGAITSVSISRSEELMRFSVGSSKSPSDLYIYNFDSQKHRRLTNSLNEEIVLEDLVDGQAIRYPSFDGLEIPAIYYKPHQASSDNKVPALVWVHGGPGGQSRQSYFPLIQYLVNNGYAILAVNNRGSSGYGKTFYRMDDQKHGDVDLKDCVTAKAWLSTHAYVDPDKIGIIGGSYGGYMVMA